MVVLLKLSVLLFAPNESKHCLSSKETPQISGFLYGCPIIRYVHFTM